MGQLMQRRTQIHTDWAALLWSIAIQIPVVVWATGHWGLGMLALGPFELIRLLLLRSVSGAYREYGDPWRAVKSFAKRAAILLGAFVGILLVPGISTFGLGKFIAVLADSSTWVFVLIPVGVLIAENALSLFFFRGDVSVQAARFDAMAADATSWFGIVALILPALLVVSFGVGLYLTDGPGRHVPDWVGNIFAVVVIIYPAAYFAGKAIVLAQVYSARFALTGRRVLDAPWALLLTSTRGQRYAKTVRMENYAIQWRRAAMLGGEVPAELDNWG